MKIPTNLSLTDDELDYLLLAASRLLRKDKEFQRLMRDLEADAAATPSTLQAPGQPTGQDAVSPRRSP